MTKYFFLVKVEEIIIQTLFNINVFQYNLFYAGSDDADRIIYVIFGTPMFLGGILALILDNTVPGIYPQYEYPSLIAFTFIISNYISNALTFNLIGIF